MVRRRAILIFFTSFLILSAWINESARPQEIRTKEQIIAKFSGRIPGEWGEVVKGVMTKLNTDRRVLALTFDACGGRRGSNYDGKLIRYLENEGIAATLFLSGREIDANLGLLQALLKNPLFEVENHGLDHKPCSAIGRSAYGIRGTKNVGEIFDEIESNALRIQSMTGRKPRYYRPGAAYADDICVEVANALGYEVVNFSVRGDAGATYSKKQVEEALLHSAPASIVLMHMNRPESQTAEGVMGAVPELRKRGFRFVKVSDFGLK